MAGGGWEMWCATMWERAGVGGTYRGPSKAASVIMDGKAVNGWRFWSVATGDGELEEGAPAEETT